MLDFCDVVNVSIWKIQERKWKRNKKWTESKTIGNYINDSLHGKKLDWIACQPSDIIEAIEYIFEIVL